MCDDRGKEAASRIDTRAFAGQEHDSSREAVRCEPSAVCYGGCSHESEERPGFGTLAPLATDTITEYARTAEVSLVVMGTHGQVGLAGVLLGSVAARVVRWYAPCPVLTLHTDVIESAGRSPRAALPVTLRSALGRFGTSRE
jgi:hypothetical protein